VSCVTPWGHFAYVCFDRLDRIPGWRSRLFGYVLRAKLPHSGEQVLFDVSELGLADFTELETHLLCEERFA